MIKYIKLHLLFLLLVFSSVFSKIASQYKYLSIEFLFFFGLSIFALVLYAFFWQKILTYFDLSIAYLNRAIVMIWIIFLGFMIWNEPLTINKIIAVICIVIGIYFISSKGNTNV